MNRKNKMEERAWLAGYGMVTESFANDVKKIRSFVFNPIMSETVLNVLIIVGTFRKQNAHAGNKTVG